MNGEFKYNEASWSVLAMTRFFLSFIVMISHLRIYFLNTNIPSWLSFVSVIGGKSAVIAFLIVSGISIGHSYDSKKKGFYKRRFLRIYPLYFFSVLLTIILQYSLGSPFPAPNLNFASAGVLTNTANFFFLQTLITITITYNGPLWSLAIEVLYYIFTPFFFKRKQVILIIIIFTSASAYFFLRKIPFPFGLTACKYLCFWLFGFLFAIKQTPKLLLIILSIILVSITYLVLTRDNKDGLYNQYLVSAVTILIFLINNKKFKLKATLQKIFNYLGDISYPLYLFHVPLYLILYGYFNVTNPYVFTLLTLLAIIPINYLFDKILKNIFWKPLVLKAEQIFDKTISNIKNSSLQKILVKVKN